MSATYKTQIKMHRVRLSSAAFGRISEMLSGLRKHSAERRMTREEQRLSLKEKKFQRNTRGEQA